MKNPNLILEKIGPLLGGLFAFGILAGLLMLGNNDSKIAENMKAELPGTSTSAITSFTPTSGKAGDLVYFTVENFSDENSEVFFGEQFAEINAFGKNEDGGSTIVVEVPQLAEIGNYAIRIVTTDGMIESSEDFEITEVTTKTEVELSFLSAALEIEAENPIDKNSSPDDFEKEDFREIENLAENFYAPVIAEIMINPPQNLQAVSTANGVELSWDELTNGEVSFYNIYYGTKSGGYIHRVISENIYEIFSKNLANGQYYFFVVSAVDANGNESRKSNEASAIYSPSASAKLVLTKVGAATSIFHATSSKPSQLSEEGPAATLLISIFVTLALLTTTFRRKIWGKF